MRIAIYIRSIATARGAEQVSALVGRGLADRGYRVDFLLEDDSGSLPEQLRRHPGVRVHVLEDGSSAPLARQWLRLRSLLAALPSPGRALLRLIWHTQPPTWALVRYVREVRPAVVLSFLNYPNASLLVAAPFCGGQTRFLVNVRNHISSAARHATSKWNRGVPELMQKLFHRADAVVAPSEGVAEDVVTITGVPRERLHVVPNPVYRPELLELAAQPVEHPWLADPAAPLILGVGKLKTQKDFATLLRAFALVRERRRARLLILGEGDEHAALQNLAEELGVAADVELPGSVENPYPYMRRASLFVLSSAWEGLPNALIEALACGCPVVSTSCPSGPSEILEGGAIGPLVAPGDHAAMARAILETLEKPPSRASLVGRARDFSLEASLDGYAGILGAPSGH